MYCVLQLWDSFAFLWPNVTWFSHKCVQADFLTCVQTDFLTNAIQTADGAVGQFTQNIGLPFQGIQQTNMSGEQVSFCLTISIINHLA